MNTNVNTANTHATTKELTQQREQQVWQLRTQCCYSHSQIAEELGISQAEVAQILKRVGTRRAEELASGTDHMIAEQVDQLMHIAMEALTAWKQSKLSPNPLAQNETPPESGVGGRTPPEPKIAEPTEPPTELTPPESGVGGRTIPESTNPEQPNSPPSLRSGLGKGAGGLGTAGKPAYLRIALQALAALRALRGLNMPYQPEIKPNADSVKMIIGVDLDSMRYKDGTHVSRAEVDRLMGEQ